MSDIPSDYLTEDVHDEHVLLIKQHLQQTHISKTSRLEERTRKRRTRLSSTHSQELQRYEFDESDDEEVTDDPVAWALASRAGMLLIVLFFYALYLR